MWATSIAHHATHEGCRYTQATVRDFFHGLLAFPREPNFAGQRGASESPFMEPVFDRLQQTLTQARIAYRTIQHEPVYTSTQAADVRGTPLHSGAKALVMKVGKAFMLIVMPADLALDSLALRKAFHVRRLRFATKEEVAEITGLTPGSIPPFGSLFGLPTICDERLSENEAINFNAGSHTNSIQMTYADYIAYESPSIARVAKETDD